MDERPGQDEQDGQPEQAKKPGQPEQPEESGKFILPGVADAFITHDAFFKFVVRDKPRLMQLLRHYWPPKIVAQLDGKREPEFMDGHYVNRQLQISQSDLLAKVYLKDGGYVFALGEHKSRHEASTMDQVYGYHMEIMSHYGKEAMADLGELPIVIPTVFHHGTDKWTSPTTHLPQDSDAAKIDVSELMLEDFRRAVRPLLIKLSDQELADLPPDRELRAGLLALIGSRVEGGNSDMLAQIFTDLRDNKSFIEQAIMYIINNWDTTKAEVMAMVKAVGAQHNIGDAPMRTAAEKLVDEGMEKGMHQGMQQGIVQGMEKGKADTLTKQLRWKFRRLPADVEMRISEASVEELDAWAESTLTAESLDEVFAAKPH
ncbi:MAG: Rpn family recombination-promoting nuclease/putative transposase [Pseudomonadales bacterium]